MKRILFLLLLTVSVYGQNPSRFAKIQITGNSNSGTATKVNVQEANGEVNTQTINTGFNKNIGLGGSDVVGANTLLNQYSTTPVDWTATAFNSGQVVFFVGKQWISKISTVAGDVPSASSKWEEITFEALANKTVIVDAIPTDGSNNAVSSNGVFDALATKAPISSVHNPVTLGTANGLSLSTQQLSLGLASSGVTGALSGTDWNTFNNKENAFSKNTAFNKNFGTTAGTVVEGGTLGSNAYNSTAYLPLSGGDVNGLLKVILDGRQLVLTGSDQGAVDLYKLGTLGHRLFSDTGSFGIYDLENDVTVFSIAKATRAATFAGTISAYPATTANQVVVKSQLDAVARPYKVYTALLSQTGTNVPTATVLENTTGETIILTRVNVGVYQMGLTAQQSKTFVLSTPASNYIFQHISVAGGGTAVNISTASLVGSTITPTDGLLQRTPIEIRIYP